MSREHRQLLLCWLALLVLTALEFGAAFLPVGRGWRPLLLLPPACCMAALVCVMFMDVRRGPALVRGFAIAGLFWLAVLLGLGMVDPLTRAVYPAMG
jgi:cytochrome c oxidase subunit IV